MFVYGVNIDRIHFKITLLVKLKCSVADPLWCGAALVITTKLIPTVVRQTLTGQRYIDDILEPILYPHFRAHQTAHRIFQDDNVYKGHVLLQILLHRRGLKICSGQAESHRTCLGQYGM